MGNSKCIIEEYCEENTIKDNEYCNYGKNPGGFLLFLLSIISAVLGTLSAVVIIILISKRNYSKRNP